MKSLTVKGMANMKTCIEKYVDRCLIDEYADKNTQYGYSLTVSELSDHEKNNFFNFLFKHDDVLQELIMDRMQELVEERLPIVESQKFQDRGMMQRQDNITGEPTWIISRGAA
jgi:hypothetical protein